MKTKSTLVLFLLIFIYSGILKSQEVKINNNFVVETDGTFRLDSSATVWDDLMVFPDATTKSGSYSPTFTLFKNNSSQGVFLWAFSNSVEQELYFSIQIPHKYKVGTAIYPHVHWTTLSTAPSGTNVTWGLEYTVVAIGGIFPTPVILNTYNVISQIGTPSGTGQHLINAFEPISGAGLGISTVLVCRLFRAVAESHDTYNNLAYLLGFDFHYQIDTEGSRTEFSK